MDNSIPTNFVPKHGGGLLRRFPPGVSGNPGGRPRGLMHEVQRQFPRDGQKLVKGLRLIAFGTAKQRRRFFGEAVKVTAHERLRAMELLSNRGWGTPHVLEDDLPFVPTGTGGPHLIFNIPRPPKELEGQKVVVDALATTPESEK